MSCGAEEIVIALYDYQANDKEELTIRKNEQLTLIDNTGPWYKVRNKANTVGLVPSNYVKVEKSKGESFVNRIANKFPKRGKGGGSSASTFGTVTQRQQGGQNINSHINNLDGVGKKSSTGIETTTMNESYVAKYTYTSNQSDELSLVKGMNIIVLAKEADGWWQGRNSDGQTGWFPSNYVEQCSAGDASQTVYPPRTVLEVARAIYPFNSGNPEELPFEKGDMFDIIDKPESDPEWYEARNSDGQVGLVPRNYIETVTGATSIFQSESQNYDSVSGDSFDGSSFPNQVSGNGDSQQGMSSKPWYFGPVKRTEAESLLRTRARNSEFIVRDSESTVGDLSVSMKAPDKIKHFKVSYKEGKYCIGQRKFDSVDSLIDHYRRAPIYTAPEVGKIYLGQPLAR